MLIKEFSSTIKKELIGTKSYNLLELKAQKIPIPDFVVINHTVFDYWLANKKLPEEFIPKLNKNLPKNAVNFSVRSSMNLEDGNNDSFAGMLETYLFVRKDDLENYIIKCFESTNNERVKAYLEHKKIQDKYITMSVVVQEMIDADASGVVFTRSPSPDNGLLLIEAGLGIGEGVVSGHVEVDQYFINRKNELITKNVPFKSKKMMRDDSNKNLTKLVDILDEADSEGYKDALNLEQIKSLTKICLEIEKIYNYPCDIEWAIFNFKIYILQCRPITTVYNELEMFIDTNLSESYPGWTSPFTGSFVTKMYELVHEEIGHYLKFSDKRMKLLKPYFSTMTTYISGHMYYRLKSYYSLLLSIPGGKQNLTNWHRMIGADSSFFKLNTNQITPSLLEIILYYYSIFKLIFFHKSIFSKFIKEAKKDLEILNQTLQNANTPHRIASSIINASTKSYGFGLTGLNDLLAMKGLNACVDFAQKNNLDENQVALMLKTNEGVESLQPLIKLNELRDLLSNNFTQDLESSIKDDTKNLTHNKVTAALFKLKEIYPVEVNACNEYLDLYGHRSFEELKIESLGLIHDPNVFIDLLKNKNVSFQTNKSNIDLFKNLGGARKIKLKIIMHFTQEFIKAREEARLLRGSFYNHIRISMIKLYESLYSSDFIFKDINLNQIFNLTLKDLELIAKAKNFNDPNYKENTKFILDKLKNDPYQKNKKTEYPEHYFCELNTQNEAYFLNELKGHINDKNELSGLGASQGNISGMVMIIDDPKDVKEPSILKDYILVTKNTDPAWIHLMACAKGLISEKGSLLSHTAIIGREMGIPTIVGVKNATKILKNNIYINIDGKTGLIQMQGATNEN